jgi:vacuolar protein sorting-associated protein 29
VPWGDKESLNILQRQLDCDVLITGHTHRLSITEENNKLFINPGSATGAYNALTHSTIPSFILMDVQPTTIVIYSYKFVENDLKVDRTEFTKK